MDRSELARLWAKTLAFIACGKPASATPFAQLLVDYFRANGVEVR